MCYLQWIVNQLAKPHDNGSQLCTDAAAAALGAAAV